MEEYIKVKDLIDMLEQRLVFQEQHGFYRDAGYTSRFIESIADIPCEDVVAKSEYDKLKEQLSQSQMENLHLREDYGDLMVRYLAAEAETAKKIFDDIFNSLPYRQNCHSQDIEFGYEWGLVEAGKAIKTLKKKYKVED
jgi:hypothetical protein